MNLTQQNFGFPGVHPLFPTSCPMMSYDFFPGPLDGQDLRHELAGRGLRGQHPDALEQITPQMVSYVYPPVNIQKTMENHHTINGKIHYFDWAMASIAM